MSTITKLNYLADTKDEIKGALNSKFNAGITDNDTFRSYVDKIKNIHNNWPKVTSEGTEITLAPTRKGKMQLGLKGNTSQISTTGKNLLDTSLLPITAYGLTISKDDSGNIVINGTPNYQAGYKSFTIGQQKTVDAGTYTTSLANKKVGLGINVGGFGGYLNITMADTVTSKTSTSSETSTIQGIVNIRYDAGTFDNYILNPMLELGSTATDYEPYTNGPSPNPDYPQPIHVVTGENSIGVQGKNILNWNLFEGNKYVNIINKTQKILSLTGKTSYYSGEYILLNLKPSTQYTIKATVTAIGTNSVGKIIIYNKNYDGSGRNLTENRIAVSNSTTAPGEVLCTFTTDETGIAYILFQCNSATNNGSITYENIQLEEGAIASSFEPYTHTDYSLNLGSIELCKIGNYQDYLYKENGNWYKYGAIDKYVYNKNLAGNGLTENTIGFLTPELNIEGNLSTTNLGAISLCNMLKTTRVGNNNPSQNTGLSGTTGAGRIRMYMSTIYATTYAEAGQLCADNNLTIYFGAKTPVITQITNENLISQLDAIENAMSTTDTTTITQTNADLPFIISASALKKGGN